MGLPLAPWHSTVGSHQVFARRRLTLHRRSDVVTITLDTHLSLSLWYFHIMVRPNTGLSPRSDLQVNRHVIALAHAAVPWEVFLADVLVRAYAVHVVDSAPDLGAFLYEGGYGRRIFRESTANCPVRGWD